MGVYLRSISIKNVLWLCDMVPASANKHIGKRTIAVKKKKNGEAEEEENDFPFSISIHPDIVLDVVLMVFYFRKL